MSLLSAALSGHLAMKTFNNLRDRIQQHPIRQTKSFNEYNFLSGQEKLAPGFFDPGRQATIGSDGSTVSNANREIIEIGKEGDDRSYYAALKNARQMAPSAWDQKLPWLLNHVQELMPSNSPREADRLLRKICGDDYVGSSVMLGELMDHGVGLPRHRALAFKAFADDMRFDMSLQRGYYVENGVKMEHTWNSVKDVNGVEIIADPTFGTMISSRSREAAKYLNANGKPAYEANVSNTLSDVLAQVSVVDIAKGNRMGVEVNISRLNPTQREELLSHFASCSISGSVTTSSAQNNAEVFRVFDPRSVELLVNELGNGTTNTQGYAPR
jgi:hypothetical protein